MKRVKFTSAIVTIGAVLGFCADAALAQTLKTVKDRGSLVCGAGGSQAAI